MKLTSSAVLDCCAQAYLAEKTSQRTVPNIFINQKHLGGCSDLLDAQKSGKLQQLMK